MNLLQTSLVYKLLAVHLMIGEANWFSGQLGLPGIGLIRSVDVRSSFVCPPSLGLGGNIQAKGYSFFFFDNHLASIVSPLGNAYNATNYAKWAAEDASVDTIGAYRLATQWLNSVSVDLTMLEERYSRSVIHLQVSPNALPKTHLRPGQRAKSGILPVFLIKWGEGQLKLNNVALRAPAVEVHLLGSTKELLELTLSDGSLLSRPLMNIANASEMNRFPDEPAMKLLKTEGWAMEDLGKLLEVPSDLRHEATQLMLDRANFFGTNLTLFTNSMREENLDSSYVWPPAFGKGGFLKTAGYEFSFDETGRLWSIESLGGASSEKNFVCDTNQVYALVSGWLGSVKIDLNSLKARYPAVIWQERMTAKKGTIPILLPYVRMRWGESELPALELSVHLPSQKLFHLRLNDSGLRSNP